MSAQYQKLISLLKELFQTDQAELDFGMYKVINQRRDEINRFLEEKLLPQIKEAFSTYQSVDTKILQRELKQAMRQAEDLGVDPDTSSKVKGIREQIATYSVDVDDLENQVYSALYNFFRRYYDEGDFISQRRYKEGVYAIPYEGEEVKLYWANHDQYYIKTSEYFRDYSFKLPSGKRAHFKLVEADTEKDNRKEIDDSKRRFVLAEDPLAWQDGEVVIRFEFRPEKAKQSKCNEQTLKTIFGLRKGLDEQIQKDGLTELAHPAPTEGNPDRTLLEKHLEDYTRRNTQDYFIHKDLGKFLRRELDFYIKNEVMHLDNIENESAPRVEEYLSKIKVIRQIAHKIIDFLAQIEDFQKKLWLKKKFVVETNYCITLDRIPEELYPKIADNDAQREEWVRLFAIDEIDAEEDRFQVPYSNPLTVEFLKDNPFLMIDTKFFDIDFKYCLLKTYENIFEQIDGILVNSENFQALRLLEETYKGKLDIYIDPPYNKGNDDFSYKDNYQHSSWLSMMNDRLVLANDLMNQDSRLAISIDDIENSRLQLLEQSIFSEDNILGVITWEKRTKAQNTQTARFMLQSKVEYIHILKMNPERQEFNLEVSGEKEYPLSDKIGKYRLHEIGQMSASGMRGRETMVFSIEGINPREGMQWKVGQDEVKRMINENRLRIIDDKPYIIMRPKHEGQEVFKPFWSHFFEKDIYGTAEQGLNEVRKNLDFGRIIETVKPVRLIEKLLFHILQENNIILDFFAGSGTTGNAVINLNREEDRKLKYILVEMEKYFDIVLKPRIQKVVYSEEWDKGRPVSRKGSSHIFKYMYLESYEDTLNNLTLGQPESTQATFLDHQAFGEDYLLHYMLNFESQNSLLDLERFETPFDYQLQIATSTVGETEATPVDLVETFNYLLGLHVQSIHKIAGVVVVRGTTHDEKQVLVIWRTVAEMDNDQLNEFYKTHLADESENITDIYVNGDNNLANIRPDDQHWTVHLTEESFHRLMFEG